MLRWLLLSFVVIGLAPGTFLRTPTGQRGDVAEVTVIPITERRGVSGELALTGAWELRSDHGWFGGFSALVASDGPGLIAGSDRGFLLDIDLKGSAPRAVPGSFRYIGRVMGPREELVDLEAVTRDPVSGTLWGAFENFNLVARYAPDGTQTLRRPPQMQRWSTNSGPETLERLADGRFIVMAEGTERGSDNIHPALLFAGDPVEAGKPLAFGFVAPPDYDPVDATALPDGRVLILLRRVEYALPARFDTAIAIADPAEIRAGEVWRAQIIQRMSGGVFADNFEGIAFVPDVADPARGAVWLVSDDNFSVFQKNVLVRFEWSR
ncbi:hypothetical protein CHX26_02845 [Porphyrobacter sp. HT-58-2]|uniref:esterase-like activity of phytase family protein n=1 Tax=Porphyrobacter sp. HT-58-2 TaxID=2023229 RepID=UPI000CDBD234|nr:esterase-like activity of phytase family protein [Porphyrobacter sp. HT-58-2]AUX68588.1 hypothetical protein CHX26_02845 [Porphyrobacter sp. HT-58-2]